MWKSIGGIESARLSSSAGDDGPPRKIGAGSLLGNRLPARCSGRPAPQRRRRAARCSDHRRDRAIAENLSAGPSEVSDERGVRGRDELRGGMRHAEPLGSDAEGYVVGGG